VPTGDLDFPFPSTGGANLHDKTTSAASGAGFAVSVFFRIAVALRAWLRIISVSFTIGTFLDFHAIAVTIDTGFPGWFLHESFSSGERLGVFFPWGGRREDPLRCQGVARPIFLPLSATRPKSFMRFLREAGS
jgi:hypothetical protein